MAALPGKGMTAVAGRELAQVPGRNVAVVVEPGVERSPEPDVAAHHARCPVLGCRPCWACAVSVSRLRRCAEDEVGRASEVALGGLVEASDEFAEVCSELIGGKSVAGGAVNALRDGLETGTKIAPGQEQACAVVPLADLPCDFE